MSDLQRQHANEPASHEPTPPDALRPIMAQAADEAVMGYVVVDSAGERVGCPFLADQYVPIALCLTRARHEHAYFSSMCAGGFIARGPYTVHALVLGARVADAA